MKNSGAKKLNILENIQLSDFVFFAVVFYKVSAEYCHLLWTMSSLTFLFVITVINFIVKIPGIKHIGKHATSRGILKCDLLQNVY
jgi:hypothetical protein